MHAQPALPALAWLAECDRKQVVVHHGPAVHAGPASFFEGAWAGSFAEQDFAAAATVAGSGASAQANGAIFVPPSHTLESLYYHLADGRLTISNSLAFLLERLGAAVRYDPHGGARFASAVLGIEDHEPVILRTDRGSIYRLLFHNLIWSDGRVRTERKPDPFPFTDYRSYRQALADEIGAVFANAGDPRRSHRYLPVSTCSSGYDSTACLVLAHELGCSRAVTLEQARGGQDDSGRDVAAQLSVQLKSFSRSEHLPEEVEAEFLASGMGGEDVIYTAFEREVRGSVLLTGFHGDKIWSMTAAPNDVLARGDVSGSSIGEFRLRCGFVHLPVPFIGALRHREIKSISNSSEMAPWSIGGPYDRPIPRRIAEDAGIPREAFGQEKKAASLLLFLEPELQSPRLRQQVAAEQRASTQTDRLAAVVRNRLFKPRLRAAHVLARLDERGRMVKPFARLIRNLLADDPRILEHDTPSASLVLSAALNSVRKRYRATTAP